MMMLQKLPFKPDQSNIVIFDDGSCSLQKITGEWHDRKSHTGYGSSPSPGAKPVRETKDSLDRWWYHEDTVAKMQ